MDLRLIPADAGVVMRRIAEAYLAAPVISADLGDIRLAPHQVDAASRLLAMLEDHGGAVLADATGLGKTFVAIAVARALGPALVVAPASLRTMWLKSLGRCGVTARVDSYERLSRDARPVGDRPALLILDEAHHARNPRSKRYAALADLAWGARVLLLTATPVHNRSRDIRALLALFLGSRAYALSDDDVRRFIVRRTHGALGDAALPKLGDPDWLAVPRDPDTMRCISEIPPAVAASDGGVAHALTLLGLIRAWTSSEEALRSTLKRRLRRAAAFVAALESGRIPDRRELVTWPVIDDAIQLGFPDLFAAGEPGRDVGRIRDAIEMHSDGVRVALLSLDRHGGASDSVRWRHLEQIAREARVPVVAFTQFADSAIAAFRAAVRRGGVALVTGREARVASGRLNVDEIVQGFDVAETRSAKAMPLELLIATDVLSEGLSLRRAGVIVHLDVPWTLARLEQRVGRLRRIGSAHRRIGVYAIGPPVESRELGTVLRALQRKARLSSGVVGDGESPSSLPLFGSRLSHATAQLVRRGESAAIEAVRHTLSWWASGELPSAVDEVDDEQFVAVALVSQGTRPRLVAVIGDRATDRPSDVLRAVRAITHAVRTSAPAEAPSDMANVLAPMCRWLDAERGRALAQLAIESPSGAHASVLRALQEKLALSPRSERSVLAARIDRCRQLASSARGIGAEVALARFVEECQPLELDQLESFLGTRCVPYWSQQHPSLVALLYQLRGNPPPICGWCVGDWCGRA